jgi:two-component sensor histidine kinase
LKAITQQWLKDSMKQALIDFFSDEKNSNVTPLDSSAFDHKTISIETIFRALDLVPSPILVGMDPDSTDIRSNKAGYDLFGIGNKNLSQSAPETERPNFVVFSDGRLVDPNDLPMQQAGRTAEPVLAPECELQFDDGTVKFIRGRAVPIFGRDGLVRGTIGVFIDVTETREAEKRHALITDEAKHRAKNTLAVVQAVAQMTLKEKLSPKDYDDFCGGINIIGASLEVFTATDKPTNAISELIKSSIISNYNSRVVLSGPDIQLPLPALTSLGMAIHELTTNACKYGALSTSTGSITIRWAKLDDLDVLSVDWIERGGPPVVPPAHKGFGSRLLSNILGSPAGKKTKITYSQDGLECRLYVGLSSVSED